MDARQTPCQVLVSYGRVLESHWPLPSSIRSPQKLDEQPALLQRGHARSTQGTHHGYQVKQEVHLPTRSCCSLDQALSINAAVTVSGPAPPFTMRTVFLNVPLNLPSHYLSLSPFVKRSSTAKTRRLCPPRAHTPAHPRLQTAAPSRAGAAQRRQELCAHSALLAGLDWACFKFQLCDCFSAWNHR